MEGPGRREGKKRQTRDRIAESAARLFAQHGYDAVSISDVARTAGVADQTVYNYFPTKPELVLDRADEMMTRSADLVITRSATQTPADVFRIMIVEEIDRFAAAPPGSGRGEFPAQCILSANLRRFALEFRYEQARTIANAIGTTDADVAYLVALAHAGALVAIAQFVTDEIGAAVVSGTERAQVATRLHEAVDDALSDEARAFRQSQIRARRGL